MWEWGGETKTTNLLTTVKLTNTEAGLKKQKHENYPLLFYNLHSTDFTCRGKFMFRPATSFDSYNQRKIKQVYSLLAVGSSCFKYN